MKIVPSYYPFRSEQARAEYTALLGERAQAWPVPCETCLIETPSAQTFVRISGHPGDPPLVLLHGAKGHSLTWIPNITALSAQYRTYALDTINDIGLSVNRQHTGRLDYLLGWLGEVLNELVPAGSVNLAGLSFGGMLAAQVALRHPERIRRLVLLAPAATVLPVSPAMLARAALTLLPGARFRRQFYDWLLHDTAHSGEAGRAYVDQAVHDWAVAERCFGPLPLTGAAVLPDAALEAFHVPTLFMVGEHEKMYSAEQAVKRLNRVAPHIRTAIIPRAGHDLWVAQADLVTAKMLDFLNEPATR
jgi:pimeloyl-ACP methyl ester carboxylesterase